MTSLRDDEQVTKMKDDLKYLQRLRQDLEKARLLIELIRKREKYKRDQIRILQMAVKMQMNPFSIFLGKALQLIEAKDTQKIFAEPVSTNDVPDYLDFVQNPMDLQTMRGKVEGNVYTSFSQFSDDISLIVDNCMFYNEKDTYYYKAAARFRDQSRNILREAKAQLSYIKYDEKGGVHSPFNLCRGTLRPTTTITGFGYDNKF